ncbi:uncharacterized protein [Drosophila pseudoobscura]|uniref:Uncharacterized protein n=1 Tax=Drosophila pseudoobscura pseudoobscura TaxID=46245 RepID=A0A6I8V703_DROPS|nr:uncharacterized protein LOC26533520 [Drosophila pseudoobscura]
MNIIFGILSCLMLPILMASGKRSCDVEAEVEVGRGFAFESLRFPKKYPPGTSCTLRAVTKLTNDTLRIRCIIDIPGDPGCRKNRFVVERDYGDAALLVTAAYCGKEEFTDTSFWPNHKAHIRAKLTTSGNKTGRFFCLITAESFPEADIDNNPKILENNILMK